MRRAGDRAPLVGAAAVVGAAGLVSLVVWEGTLERQSTAAHWSVALCMVAVVATALVLGRRRQRRTSGRWITDALDAARHWTRRPAYTAGVVVWVVLTAAVIGWDLASFIHQAHDLPTLSYEFGRLTRYHWGRAVVFAGWLALGLLLAAGWRRAAAARRAGDGEGDGG